MAKSSPDGAADPSAAANQLSIERRAGKTDEQQMTEIAMSPLVRNTMTAKSFAGPSFLGEPPVLEVALHLMKDLARDVREGNLDKLTEMLAAQAVALDAIFTEYSRRSLLNAGEYMGATQTYASLALKAQANCRTAIESLAKIHRGGKQTVKVVHIHEGAQAVVADTFNQGGADGKSVKQPHAKAGDAPVAALRSRHETEEGLQIPGDAERQMSHARRKKPGRTNRQS